MLSERQLSARPSIADCVRDRGISERCRRLFTAAQLREGNSPWRHRESVSAERGGWSLWQIQEQLSIVFSLLFLGHVGSRVLLDLV